MPATTGSSATITTARSGRDSGSGSGLTFLGQRRRATFPRQGPSPPAEGERAPAPGRRDRRRRLSRLAPGRLADRGNRHLDVSTHQLPSQVLAADRSRSSSARRKAFLSRTTASTPSSGIGGFNYFDDPERSLREMARVVRPGGSVVISDEVPNLTDRMKLGRLIGWPGLDRWGDRQGHEESWRGVHRDRREEPRPRRRRDRRQGARRLQVRADLAGRRLCDAW